MKYKIAVVGEGVPDGGVIVASVNFWDARHQDLTDPYTAVIFIEKEEPKDPLKGLTTDHVEIFANDKNLIEEVIKDLKVISCIDLFDNTEELMGNLSSNAGILVSKLEKLNKRFPS